MDIRKIYKLEWEDIFASIKLLCAYIPAQYVRKAKHPWLICERMDNAQDNAWIFYHWLKRNHPNQQAFFVLSKSSPTFDSNDKNMISWGSFRHYIYYIASKIFVKAMFNGPEPSARVCNAYQSVFDKKLSIYLRHGIAKDGCEHHRYDVLRVRMFVCGAKPEYDYLHKNAGYPEGYLKYTGFARFDDLIEDKADKNFILFLPTWRRYLCDSSPSKEKNEELFLQSSFYKHYQGLLNNKEFIDFLEMNNLTVKFCLHAEFRRYEHLFKVDNPHVEFLDNKANIHQLLMDASLLITDYSSVFFDMGYMNKPTIYYQFDYEEFRSNHLSEGYFSYERDGFGPISHDIKSLLDCIIECRKNGVFEVSPKYLARIERFFPLQDSHNCERIYNSIKEIEEKDGRI